MPASCPLTVRYTPWYVHSHTYTTLVSRVRNQVTDAKVRLSRICLIFICQLSIFHGRDGANLQECTNRMCSLWSLNEIVCKYQLTPFDEWCQLSQILTFLSRLPVCWRKCIIGITNS